MLLLSEKMIDAAMEHLLPSWWEIKITVSAAAFFAMAVYWYLFAVGGAGIDRSLRVSRRSGVDGKDKVFGEIR